MKYINNTWGPGVRGRDSLFFLWHIFKSGYITYKLHTHVWYMFTFMMETEMGNAACDTDRSWQMGHRNESCVYDFWVFVSSIQDLSDQKWVCEDFKYCDIVTKHSLDLDLINVFSFNMIETATDTCS